MTVTDQQVRTGAPGGVQVPIHDPRTAERMVATVARFAVEIVRAQRPSTTLARIVTPEILEMLERRAALTRRLHGLPPGATRREVSAQAVLSGVRTCVVNDRVVEASVVVREPGRARFLAMRWELRHTGWKVTVLELG